MGPADVPLFFHVPRSGGATLLEIMGTCVGLILSSDMGARDGHDTDPSLQVVETPLGSYVNVDTYTESGLQRAVSLDLLGSGMVDVVSTNIPVAATMLFQNRPNFRGRMFVFLRDPVERAASVFFDRQKTDQYLAGMSLETYASSNEDLDEFNYLVKMLVNKPGHTTATLTEEDLDTAKEVLRRKTLIGLLGKKGDSLLRFEQYFGWKYDSAEDKTCAEKVLHWEWKNKGPDRGPVAKGSKLYQDLAERNAFDVELYAYAVRLFDEQGAVLKNQQKMLGAN